MTYTPPTSRHPQTGELCVPASNIRTIAIVLVHGGGGATGQRSDLRAWRDHYLRNGYPVLNIDYALIGSTGNHGVFPLPEQNLKAAVQFLRKGSSIRAGKIVVHGNSAGARLGGIALTTANHPRFSGAELWPGVSDSIDGLVGFYGYYNGFQFDGNGYFGVGVPIDPVADSHRQASGATGPVILFHGTEDDLIDVNDSRRFAERLRSAGKTADLQVLQGQNHAFDGYAKDKLTPAGAEAGARILTWLARL